MLWRPYKYECVHRPYYWNSLRNLNRITFGFNGVWKKSSLNHKRPHIKQRFHMAVAFICRSWYNGKPLAPNLHEIQYMTWRNSMHDMTTLGMPGMQSQMILTSVSCFMNDLHFMNPWTGHWDKVSEYKVFIPLLPGTHATAAIRTYT